MAEKRMFNKLIIDSDKFSEMPLSTQALYFHLCMRTDNEGFMNSPRMLIRSIGCSTDDLSILLSKNFITKTEYGVYINPPQKAVSK